VGVAVGEEPVDEGSEDGEEEDDEQPDELRGGRAVGLEDLGCRELAKCVERKGDRTRRMNIPKMMTSRIRTTRPRSPPPVP